MSKTTRAALSFKKMNLTMFNLVERLRKATSPRSFDHIGAMQITNPPICIEAANVIELLEAERDMLKAALEKVLYDRSAKTQGGFIPSVYEMQRVAKAALANLTPQTQDIDPAAPDYDARASHEVGK